MFSPQALRPAQLRSPHLFRATELCSPKGLRARAQYYLVVFKYVSLHAVGVRENIFSSILIFPAGLRPYMWGVDVPSEQNA